MKNREISKLLGEFYDKFSSWEHSVVRGSELSPTQMHTLEIIGNNPEMKMRELAEKLGITTGTLTVGVDKLEKKELVERIAHQSDRRSWLISLTPKGVELFQEHHKFHQNYSREICASLSKEEQNTLCTILKKMIPNM